MPVIKRGLEKQDLTRAWCEGEHSRPRQGIILSLVVYAGTGVLLRLLLYDPLPPTRHTTAKTPRLHQLEKNKIESLPSSQPSPTAMSLRVHLALKKQKQEKHRHHHRQPSP